MSRRDILNEILLKRGRIPSDKTRLDLFNKRSDQIEEAFLRLARSSDPHATTCDVELTRYVPVALVASIEGYFRLAIADLIDKGSPFIERVAELRDVNISVDSVVAIQTQKISFGEYVSHFVSLSNLEDINRAMSTLLHIDFLERLLSSEFEFFKNEHPVKLEEVRGIFVVLVKDLFSTRHILCHEFAQDVLVDNSQMSKYMIATTVFVVLSEMIIWAEESLG